MNLQLATRALSLLVDVELELVLLLLNQLLSNLLLLYTVSLKLLVLLEAFNVVHSSLIIQFHQTIINEMLNFAFKVDLLVESLLKPFILSLHLCSLRNEILEIFALLILSCLVFLDLFSASSSFG